ncbi:MAG TPA: helix-turn-helix transcriptional regulator [Pseudomonadales bacterium]
MVRSDEQWLDVADAFGTAALDGSWYDALASLADACGARSGQLVGFGAGTVDFNCWTEVSPEVVEEFAAIGGGDPAVNPRVRAGRSVGELTVLTERDFLTPDEFSTNELYTWGRTHDVVFSCLSPLIHTPEMMVGCAVIRGRADGHFETAERAVFASLAPHVRAAVRTRRLLEGQAAALLTGTLDALSLAAFVCDAGGRVVAHTPMAEAELERGRLRLQHGRLGAAAEGAGALVDAIAEAVAGLRRPGAPLQRTVLLTDDMHAEPLVLDVFALPRRAADLSPRARAVVVVRGPLGEPSDLAEALRGAWGLTRAEADVALMLARGRSTAEIAEARDVSVGTVRIQSKSIYAKVGVKRQAELGARLRPLL